MEKESSTYDYSKTFSRKERKQAAVDIGQQREAYFDRQELLDDKLSEALDKEKEIERVFEEIEELEDYVRSLEGSFLRKIVNTLELRKVRAKIGVLKNQVSEESPENIREDIRGLEEARADRHEMDEAKRILSDFWQDQAVEYQEAEEAGQVESASRNYGCYIVHCFSAYFTPERFSMLKDGLSWKDKLDIFLAFRGTASCSAVNENRPGMWSNVGVILNGGRILEAYSSDAETTARGLKDRSSNAAYASGDIKDHMDIAMTPIHGNMYNELVVEDPQIAGIFFSLDKQHTDGSDVRETMKVAQQYGMPIYVFSGGKLYNWTGSGCDYSAEVEKESVLDADLDLTQVAEEIRARFENNTPFKQQIN